MAVSSVIGLIINGSWIALVQWCWGALRTCVVRLKFACLGRVWSAYDFQRCSFSHSILVAVLHCSQLSSFTLPLVVLFAAVHAVWYLTEREESANKIGLTVSMAQDWCKWQSYQISNARSSQTRLMRIVAKEVAKLELNGHLWHSFMICTSDWGCLTPTAKEWRWYFNISSGKRNYNCRVALGIPVGAVQHRSCYIACKLIFLLKYLIGFKWIDWVIGFKKTNPASK